MEARLACPGHRATVTLVVDGKKAFKVGHSSHSEESAVKKIRDALKTVSGTEAAKVALAALAEIVVTEG